MHVDAELLPNADARAAFIAGVRKAKAATLEALVPILDVTTSGDDCFVVYGAPQSAFPLEEIFAEMSSEDRRAEIPRFAVLLAKSLSALHRAGIVQGLLSLSTVFEWERGYATWQYQLASLCDHAKVMRRLDDHVDGVFRAPEVIEGARFSQASDIFCWAVLVATFATEAEPAEAIEMADDGRASTVLSEALLEIVQVSLSYSPDERPSDADALLEWLEETGIAKDLPISRAGTGNAVWEWELTRERRRRAREAQEQPEVNVKAVETATPVVPFEGFEEVPTYVPPPDDTVMPAPPEPAPEPPPAAPAAVDEPLEDALAQMMGDPLAGVPDEIPVLPMSEGQSSALEDTLAAMLGGGAAPEPAPARASSSDEIPELPMSPGQSSALEDALAEMLTGDAPAKAPARSSTPDPGGSALEDALAELTGDMDAGTSGAESDMLPPPPELTALEGDEESFESLGSLNDEGEAIDFGAPAADEEEDDDWAAAARARFREEAGAPDDDEQPEEEPAEVLDEELEAERLERERLEQERRERERLAAEKRERDRLEQEERERAWRERQRLRQEEWERGRVEQERREQEWREMKRLEEERIEQMRREQEEREIEWRARLEREEEEREAREIEERARLEEQAREREERAVREAEEQARAEVEEQARAEVEEQARAEEAEREAAAREQRERARREAERLEREAERERREAEREQLEAEREQREAEERERSDRAAREAEELERLEREARESEERARREREARAVEEKFRLEQQEVEERRRREREASQARERARRERATRGTRKRSYSSEIREAEAQMRQEQADREAAMVARLERARIERDEERARQREADAVRKPMRQSTEMLDVPPEMWGRSTPEEGDPRAIPVERSASGSRSSMRRREPPVEVERAPMHEPPPPQVIHKAADPSDRRDWIMLVIVAFVVGLLCGMLLQQMISG
ncbi:MAG: hypothetical protein H6713_29280 [Myxococcales bacterium]|nr:hypothetical protein [Myxococcales bacterium]